MTWNLAQKNSLQKHSSCRNAFLKSHIVFQDKVEEVVVSYYYSLTFSYMNLNLHPIVTTLCMLYNCHCILILSFDAANELPW